jgi:nitroreductase
LENMELKEAILARKSIRSFLDQPVDESHIRAILELAVRAPSGGNAQPWIIHVIRDAKARQKLVKVAHGQDFVGQAPVDLVICIDRQRTLATYGERGLELYSIQDTAALIEHILLLAVDLGLGTCWVGAFDESACSKTLSLSDNERPIAIIPLGYPAKDPSPRPRRPLEEVVFWD